MPWPAQKLTYLVGSHGRVLSIDPVDLASIDPDDADTVERVLKDRILDDVRRNVILDELVPGDAADVIARFAEAIRDVRAERDSAAARQRASEARTALERRRAAGGRRRR